MKKAVVLFLAVILCLSLASCIKMPVATTDVDIYLETSEDGIVSVVFPNSRAFSRCISKVEITQENWSEYFEDYEYTEHIVKMNDFGDIEEEYDAVRIGFGLKRNILGCVDNVSFKFDGMTKYSSGNFRAEDRERVEYKMFRANQSVCGVYSYVTDQLLAEEELEEDEVKSHYLLEMKYHIKEDKIQFGEYNCIDAMGTLYIIDLPEGIYNGETVNQIKWASGGGAGFGTSNVKNYYKE